jgi:hypothetical protein
MAGKGSKNRVKKFSTYQYNYTGIKGFAHNGKFDIPVEDICQYCGNILNDGNWSFKYADRYCSENCFKKAYGVKE